MFSRSMCIVTLFLLGGQMLLAGVMLTPTLGLLHPTWRLRFTRQRVTPGPWGGVFAGHD